MQIRNKEYFSIYTQVGLKRSLFLFLFCIAILFPYKGFCNDKAMASHAVIVIHKQDNGKEISAHVGDVIQVELESLGSAGYQWFLNSVDTNYVELISEETKATDEKGKMGAPVISTWCFKLLKKGLTDIRMYYYRSWEGKENALDYFHVTITIS